jgi:hypothetical protein
VRPIVIELRHVCIFGSSVYGAPTASWRNLCPTRRPSFGHIRKIAVCQLGSGHPRCVALFV